MEPAQEGPIFDLACMRSSETRPSWACVSASLRFSCSGLVVSLVTNLTLRDPLSTTRCCGQPSALFQARGQTSTTPRKKPSHVFGTSFTRQAAPRQRGVEIHLSASERLCCPLQALQTSGLASARVAAVYAPPGVNEDDDSSRSNLSFGTEPAQLQVPPTCGS
jgi:hypothetical protein